MQCTELSQDGSLGQLPSPHDALFLYVQVLIVHISCMAYEFFLLQRCNIANMRVFTVFLALPSATVSRGS